MTQPTLFSIIVLTLEVAILAVVCAAPLAISLAWLLARRPFFGRTIVEMIVALPLVLPPTAIGYLLLAVFARQGLLGESRLGFDPGILFTKTAAIMASAVMAFPLMTRTCRAAFEDINPRLELMARSLGVSRLKTFVRITLPLARRGLLAGLALGLGRALGEFGATVIVAGSIPGKTQTLSLAIFESIQLSDDRRARLLVGITALMALILTWSIEKLLHPAHRRPRERRENVS